MKRPGRYSRRKDPSAHVSEGPSFHQSVSTEVLAPGLAETAVSPVRNRAMLLPGRCPTNRVWQGILSGEEEFKA